MTWFIWNFLALMICSVSFLPASQALAITRHVPGEVPTIQAGLDASAAGDTIRLACGTYLEYNLTMKAGVTLMGESEDPSCVIIDAQNQGRILDCVDLVPLSRIEGISFVNGYTIEGWFDALGGGVRSLNSNVTISNCVFQGNSSRIGAGFGASESNFELRDCKFISNTAIHPDWAAGGAVWARDCSGDIGNCEIRSNTAFSDNPGDPGDGGGFFFNNTRLNVTGCLFLENSTGAGAGGFYSVTNDSSIFTDCDFTANTAGFGGAVFYEYEATAQFINCNFTNNIAKNGGAIETLNGSLPKVVGCLFEGNQATQGTGGAINGWFSEVSISGSTFRNNSAQSHGGCASFNYCGVEIVDSVFMANSTSGDGGVVRCFNTNVAASGCTMVGNSASAGAGIYCDENSTTTIDHCIIAFSTMGESISGQVAGFASISCSDFFGNSGGDWVNYFADQLSTNNNFSSDPRFCNPAQNNYSLDSSSPCALESQIECGQVGALGVGCSVSASPSDASLPSNIYAVENFPNPFNPSTTIRFSLDQAGPTSVAVFDMAGRLVRTLMNSNLSAQAHEVRWMGQNNEGRKVAAGIYFYQINSGGAQWTGRLALVK